MNFNGGAGFIQQNNTGNLTVDGDLTVEGKTVLKGSVTATGTSNLTTLVATTSSLGSTTVTTIDGKAMSMSEQPLVTAEVNEVVSQNDSSTHVAEFTEFLTEKPSGQTFASFDELNRLVINEACNIQLSASVRFLIAGATPGFVFQVVKNGVSTIIDRYDYAINSGTIYVLPGSIPDAAAPGDAYSFQYSISGVTLASTDVRTRFEVTKLA